MSIRAKKKQIITLDSTGKLTRNDRRSVAKSAEEVTSPSASRSDYGLTSKEKQILRCMVEGLTMHEIADRLSISYNTITSHFKHIYRKLQLHNRGAVVAKTLKENLL